MALLFRSTVDSAARWRAQLTRLTEQLDIRVWPEIGNPAEIDYALVWRPEPGFLASLPNLKLILSLGAGVDHLLGDPLLPRHLPIVRLVDPHMTHARDRTRMANCPAPTSRCISPGTASRPRSSGQFRPMSR